MSDAVFVTVGSIGRAWAFQFRDSNGQPLNFSQATNVRFSMSPRGSTTRKVNDQTAVVGNGSFTLPDGSVATFTPTDGVLIYQPVAQDVDTAEVFLGQFTYLLAGSTVVDPGYLYCKINIQAAI